MEPTCLGDLDALEAVVERLRADRGVGMAEAAEPVVVVAEQVRVDGADADAEPLRVDGAARPSRRRGPTARGWRRSGRRRSARGRARRRRASPRRSAPRPATGRRGSACRSCRSPTTASRSRGGGAPRATSASSSRASLTERQERAARCDDAGCVRVALFVTCLTDTLLPETGIATVRLLERLGHQVTFPREQTCCGQMHLNTGYQRRGARARPPLRPRLRRRGGRSSRRPRPASATVREYYPRLAEGDAALERQVEPTSRRASSS